MWMCQADRFNQHCQEVNIQQYVIENASLRTFFKFQRPVQMKWFSLSNLAVLAEDLTREPDLSRILGSNIQ
jgi:hypothetical protein